MEIPEHIKRFAKKSGFPDVNYLGIWGNFVVYNAFDKDFPYIGLPQYILQNGNSIEWATPKQTEDLMAEKF